MTALRRVLLFIAHCVSGAALALISVLVLAEIIARNVFESSTYIATEMSGYLIAAFTVFGLCACICEGTTLRIGLLGEQLVGRLIKRASEALNLIIAIFVLGFAGYFFFVSASRNFSRGYSSGTILGVPIWIPEAVLIAGFVLCAVATVVWFVTRSTKEESHRD